ncbi:hypothetical protein GIB67_021992, partial [Kingdonia uniflora]
QFIRKNHNGSPLLTYAERLGKLDLIPRFNDSFKSLANAFDAFLSEIYNMLASNRVI